MKFQCPQCKKEFSLAASKLQPGVVRIRCTSCGSVIKMRIGASAGRPDGEPDGAAPSVQYWAVIGQSKVGPMPFLALKRLIQEQKVTRATLLWNKNLSAWTRASHIPDVAALLPPQEDSSAARPLPQKPAEPAPAAAPAAPVAAPIPTYAPAPSAPAPVPAAKPAQPEPEPAKPAAAPQAAPQPPKAPGPPVPPPKRSPIPGAQPAPSEEDEALFPVPPIPSGPPRSMPGMPSGEHDAIFPQAPPPRPDQAKPGTPRSFDLLDIPDDADFAMKVEEGQARGAHDSLRDFSMMVRLSAAKRKRNVVIVITVIALLVAVGAVVTVIALMQPPKVEAKVDHEEDDDDSAAPSDFLKQSTGTSNGTKKPGKELAVSDKVIDLGGPAASKNTADITAARGAITAAMGEADDEFEFSVTDAPDTSAIKIRKTRPQQQGVATAQGETSKPVKGSAGKAPELSLSQLAAETDKQLAETIKGGAPIDPNASRSLSESATVKLSGSSKGAASGAALVRSLKKSLLQHLSGSKRKIRACGAKFGLEGSEVRIRLHISEAGVVDRISSDDAGASVQKCLLETFSGWSTKEVNRAVVVPITLNF